LFFVVVCFGVGCGFFVSLVAGVVGWGGGGLIS